MADDAELSRSLAILDTILAAKFPGWEQVASYIDSGTIRRADEDHRRRAMLSSTRVDFAMLNDAPDKETEDEN